MTEAVIGLVGVLVGAVICWLMTSQFEKRQNAVALYTEFAAPDLEKCHGETTRFLLSNLQSPNPLTFQEMHERADEPSLRATSRLLHF